MRVRRLDEELSGDVSNGAADHNVRLAKNSCFCFQALDTLSTVAPLCLDDYMTCQSNTRLLMLLEWCVGEGKHCLIFSFVCILLQSL